MSVTGTVVRVGTAVDVGIGVGLGGMGGVFVAVGNDVVVAVTGVGLDVDRPWTRRGVPAHI